MDILLFLVSYVMLDVIGSLFYVGVLLFSFLLMKKVFNMDENKWNALFKFGRGTGFYFMMLFPYLVMLVAMFFLSIIWFNFLNFKYSTLSSLSVVIGLTLIMTFAFPKLRFIVKNKLQENH